MVNKILAPADRALAEEGAAEPVIHLDEGRSPNVPAPAIAIHYWKLPATATLRDVVLVVRADEAHHRDVNHGFASSLAGTTLDRASVSPYPPHAAEIHVGA